MVVSEIVSRQHLHDRVACIEKWAAIADICRFVMTCLLTISVANLQ